jgi:hypothetical protein
MFSAQGADVVGQIVNWITPSPISRLLQTQCAISKERITTDPEYILTCWKLTHIQSEVHCRLARFHGKFASRVHESWRVELAVEINIMLAGVKLHIFCAELLSVRGDFDPFGHQQLQIDIGTRKLDISIRTDFISNGRPATQVDIEIGGTFRTCFDTGFATHQRADENRGQERYECV